MTKILYIEDEPSLAKIVKESLESRDFIIEHLSDGSEAQKHIQEFHPDLCLLDVMLPVKDGFTIGKEIKEKFPALPIIFITAKDQTKDIMEGFNSGGNDYIKKPFSLEELIIRIRNILSLTKGREPSSTIATLSIGAYSFDTQTYELTQTNETRKLSHREAQLLQLLHQFKGNIVERKFILDSLWGDDHFFNSRNLDVYITKLRSYLKEDDKIEIITLKGVGYRMVF